MSLSQGQRQRLAIARAAIRRAPILILDEPTTGLDEKNEQEVIEALERLARGRTTFIISHNLQFAARADSIIYLEECGVLERGAHLELMAAQSRYAALYRLQTAEPKPDGKQKKLTQFFSEDNHLMKSVQDGDST